MAKKSISYPDQLHETVTAQVEAGVSESYSEWFREAAYIRLSLQRTTVEAVGGVIKRDDLTAEEAAEALRLVIEEQQPQRG